MPPVIECLELTKSYSTRTTALNNITLTIASGTSFGLLGESKLIRKHGGLRFLVQSFSHCPDGVIEPAQSSIGHADMAKNSRIMRPKRHGSLIVIEGQIVKIRIFRQDLRDRKHDVTCDK